jgi:adenylate cyclase
MTLEVPLGSIRAAFQGVIPSPVATASADGEPHSTYLSIVWYVDEERIALSNQFMNTTARNMRENPHVVVRVVDPGTMEEYEITAERVHSEAAGPTFEAMRTQLEAIAAQTGMAGVFRLRTAEILRVTQCRATRLRSRAALRGITPVVDLLSSLEEFGSRLASAPDLDDVTRIGLEALDDLFQFRHSMLLLADAQHETLFVVASSGYRPAGIGAEIATNDGLLGVAAIRRRQVRIANVERSRILARAATAGADEIPLPGLPTAQSVLATPLLMGDQLVGVLYLDSERAGRFGPEDARLVSVVANMFATSIALHSDARDDEPGGTTSIGPALGGTGRAIIVDVYEQNGSVFFDGDYVIKGVAGRALAAMLEEFERSARTTFSNRELRLNPTLELSPGKDNLEARLLTLRRRLDQRDDPVRLRKAGRGRLRLELSCDVAIERHAG